MHFGNDAFRSLNPIPSGLTEPFLISDLPDRANLVLDISRDEFAISTDSAIQIDKMVGVTDGWNPLFALFSRLDEALVLKARRIHGLLRMFPTHHDLWGTPEPPLGRLAARRLFALLNLFEGLLSRRQRLVSRPLFRD